MYSIKYIFAQKTYISRLEMNIFKLDIYISKLEILLET